jgi:hypothetical protein
MDKRLGLGWSAISKSEFPASRAGAWRRVLLFVLALIVVGFVFGYITRAIQSSTAHATRPDVSWDLYSD